MDPYVFRYAQSKYNVAKYLSGCHGNPFFGKMPILCHFYQHFADFWVSRFSWTPPNYGIVQILMNSIVMMLHMAFCTLRPHQNASTYDRSKQFGHHDIAGQAAI